MYIPAWLKTKAATKSKDAKAQLEEMRSQIKKQTALIEQAVKLRETEKKAEK